MYNQSETSITLNQPIRVKYLPDQSLIPVIQNQLMKRWVEVVELLLCQAWWYWSSITFSTIISETTRMLIKLKIKTFTLCKHWKTNWAEVKDYSLYDDLIMYDVSLYVLWPLKYCNEEIQVLLNNYCKVLASNVLPSFSDDISSCRAMISTSSTGQLVPAPPASLSTLPPLFCLLFSTNLMCQRCVDQALFPAPGNLISISVAWYKLGQWWTKNFFVQFFVEHETHVLNVTKVSVVSGSSKLSAVFYKNHRDTK